MVTHAAAAAHDDDEEDDEAVSVMDFLVITQGGRSRASQMNK